MPAAACAPAPPSPPSPRPCCSPAPAGPGSRPRRRRCSAPAAASRSPSRLVAKAENGTISPLALRTYQLSRSSGQHAVRRVGLHIDPLDAAAVDEVVDVAASPRRSTGCVLMSAERQPERARLLLVDLDPALRRVLQAVRAHRRQRRVLRAPCRATGRAPAISCSWPRPPRSWSCMSKPVALPSSRMAGGVNAKTMASVTCDSAPIARRRCAATLRSGAAALVPVLQVDEAQAGVLAAAGEAEAGDGEERRRRCPSRPRGSSCSIASTRLSVRSLVAPGGSVTWTEQDALVLVRQERGRQAQEQHAKAATISSVDDQIPARPVRSCAPTPPLIAVGAAVEGAVEPAEEAAPAFGRW